MKKATALKVLKEIEAKHAEWLKVSEEFYPGHPDNRPILYNADHEQLSKGSWSIAWEGTSPEDWAINFETSIPGVFVEPIFSFVLGIYDNN